MGKILLVSTKGEDKCVQIELNLQASAGGIQLGGHTGCVYTSWSQASTGANRAL